MEVQGVTHRPPVDQVYPHLVADSGVDDRRHVATVVGHGVDGRPRGDLLHGFLRGQGHRVDASGQQRGDDGVTGRESLARRLGEVDLAARIGRTHVVVVFGTSWHATDLNLEHHAHRLVADDGAPAFGRTGDDPGLDGGVGPGIQAW